MNGRNPILFMNLIKISIVKYAIKNETNKPNRLISKFSTRYAESILISKYIAIAEMVGIDIKKLILDAVLLSSPRNNPAEIVTPDLDTPGIRERVWTKPIINASVMVVSSKFVL